MEIDSQRGFRSLSFENLSEPEQLHYSHARKAFECHSTCGHMAPNCLRKDCHFCADIATIDEEISTAYQRIFDLIQKRGYFTRKPNHDTLIHRLPAEILSSIFVFVKEACDDESGKPSFRLPYFSPPLLVGSVCKKWRDISLQTPQLWTDIIIDLMKPVDAQLDMVNNSANRSGALPLNLIIFVEEECFDYESDILERCDVVLPTLRSLSIRWNDVALQGPWSVCYKLLNELENSSRIPSFHIFLFDWTALDFAPIKLQEPFRPKYFYAWHIFGSEVPFEWDNLVHLQITFVSLENLLHIIQNAKNLRHCEARPLGVPLPNENVPSPPTPITHHSLTFFKSDILFMDHLTLPSLQHLDCSIFLENLDNLVGFINRSSPLLATFVLHCTIPSSPQGDLDPCFKKLPGLTSLFVSASSYNNLIGFLHTLIQPSSSAILPRLNELSLYLSSISPSSWSLISSLFKKDTHPDGPHSKETGLSATSILGRPLSRIRISVSGDTEMDKDTFLDLLALKKSGVDLILKGCEGDLFRKMAELHDIPLV